MITYLHELVKKKINVKTQFSSSSTWSEQSFSWERVEAQTN